MDNVKKRDRSVNFTREEIELLLSLVESKLQTIENKKSGAIAWHDKEKAWMAIEKSFNNSTTARIHQRIHRSARHLKAKYEALKRDTRKKACIIRGGLCTEGFRNGEVFLSEAEKKVFYMVLQANDGDFSEAEQICHLDVKRNRSMSSTEFVSTDIESSDMFENNINNEQNDDTCDSKCLSNILGRHEPEDVLYEENPLPKTNKSFRNEGTKTKRKIDDLIESVSDVVLLKKKILEEEIKEKIIQRKTHEEELQHRREMRALENQQMLLKIEILKAELESTGRKN